MALFPLKKIPCWLASKIIAVIHQVRAIKVIAIPSILI
jgi:hypothetical protein